MLSRIANKFKINKFIHLSALGIDEAIDSKYATSKLEGEKRIIKNFNNHIIIRPSIVYSVDDNFTTNFMTLLNRLPVMPLYYQGKTKFSPIHVSDLTDIIFNIIERGYSNLILECVGPEILSFKEILESLLGAIDKKRLLIPLPYQIAAISAKILQLLPKPLLTEDQLKLLKYDNIKSENYKTNFDLKLDANRKFKFEINKYSYNWRSGGQFANKELIEKND